MAALREFSNTISDVDAAFVVKSVKNNCRVDGRENFQRRKINLDFGRIGGKSRLEVAYGSTRVLAVVSAEVVAPFPDRPNEGFLEINTSVSPMASPEYEAGKTSDLAIEIGTVVERGLKDTKAIDLEALCIVAGSKVWNVRCDITVIDHNGNATDPAMLATVGALLHFRKPDVTVVGDQVTIHALNEREPVPLAVHFIPLSTTYGFFEDDEMVVDPSDREELVMLGNGSFVVNSHREICGVHKHGRPGISHDLLMKCISTAANQYQQVADQLNAELEKAELLAKEAELEKALRFTSVQDVSSKQEESSAMEE